MVTQSTMHTKYIENMKPFYVGITEFLVLKHTYVYYSKKTKKYIIIL